MIDTLFDASTIPVLEQVVQFNQSRHAVLAGNLANLDTPGYRVRDLSVDDFQDRLKQAIDARRRPSIVQQSSGLHGTSPERQPSSDMAEVARNTETILYHDDSNVGVEHQVTEIAKNQMLHNMAISIMTAQFRLLQVAVSERA